MMALVMADLDKSFKSNPRKFAFGVDTILFRSSFTVCRSAAGVDMSRFIVILLPSTVTLFLFASAFFGLLLHTILQFIISFYFLSVFLLLFMKCIVSMPLLRPGMHCVRQPTSFTNKYFQGCLYFGCLIKCRYSINSPVAPSSTAAASAQKNVRGNLCCKACFAFTLKPAIADANLLVLGCSCVLEWRVVIFRYHGQR